MARLRPTGAVRVLTVEEKTRVANFFMLLVEINIQKKVIGKRRSSNSKKSKTSQRPSKANPISEKSYIRSFRARNSSRSAPRNLYLKSFDHIFRCNTINFTMEYFNDRYYHFIA